MAKLNRITQYILPFLFLCAAFLLGQALDQMADIAKENAAAEAQNSREWAARQTCGENAAWKWDGDDLQCYMHNGKKTGKVISLQEAATQAK